MTRSVEQGSAGMKLEEIVAQIRELAEKVDSETHREWADELAAYAAQEKQRRERLSHVLDRIRKNHGECGCTDELAALLEG